MTVNQYWVGARPSRPIDFTIRDGRGNPINLTTYTTVVKMIDPNNDEVDLTGSTLLTAQASSGVLVFRWPVDRSLFTMTGEYLMQVELLGSNTRDITTSHSIKVRRLGGVD